MLDRLNRPLFLVALALVLFLAHFTLVIYSLDLFSPCNFNGMWITIPDFDKGINDPDSALTRIYYRLNGWDGQWYYHIAANGYQCDSIPETNNPHVCNVAFFPLVPMLGSLLGLTGIDLVYALPLVSQLFYLSSILLLLFFIVVLTSLGMIMFYYYFYSSLGTSVGAGITNLVRHLLPTMGIAAILLIAARPRKPEWLSNGLLVSFVVAFLAVEFYFQKQLLDLFRYGYWVS